MERKPIPWYKAFELPLLLLFTLALLYLLFKLIGYVLPLLVASVLAFLMEPMIRFLSVVTNKKGEIIKRGIPRKAAVIVTMLLVFSMLTLLLSLLIGGITGELIKLSTRLPQTLPLLGEHITAIIDGWKEKASFISPGTLDALTNALNAIGQKIMTELGATATRLLSMVTRFPSLMLFVIVMVLSTYFIAGDRDKMMVSIEKQIPKNWLLILYRLYNTLLKALWGWIRAQFLIMICMFGLLFIGLLILRVPYALLIAVCIAVLDALPVLGSGLILLPWSVYHIVFGIHGLGFGLLILYIVAASARQTLEPRLVGVRFGLPPLMTMAAMYAGLSILGFWGLLLGPLVTLILMSVVRAYLNGRTYRDVIGRNGKHRSAPQN